MNPEISYYRLGGLQASGNFLIKKVPTAGDTITIDGETFTFGTTFNGDTIYDVARSLKLAINADSSTYAHAHTSINPSRSTYAIYYGPRVVVVASVPGTAGNSIAIASSNTDAIEASGATLSGGTAGPLIGGGGGTPGDTVITETTYGQAESAGVATEFSRADHTHGTPALPTPAEIGAAEVDHTHAGFDSAATVLLAQDFSADTAGLATFNGGTLSYDGPNAYAVFDVTGIAQYLRLGTAMTAGRIQVTLTVAAVTGTWTIGIPYNNSVKAVTAPGTYTVGAYYDGTGGIKNVCLRCTVLDGGAGQIKLSSAHVYQQNPAVPIVWDERLSSVLHVQIGRDATGANSETVAHTGCGAYHIQATDTSRGEGWSVNYGPYSDTGPYSQPNGIFSSDGGSGRTAVGDGARACAWRSTACGTGAKALKVSSTVAGWYAMSTQAHTFVAGRGVCVTPDGPSNASCIIGEDLYLDNGWAHQIVHPDDTNKSVPTWGRSVTPASKPITIHGPDAYDARKPTQVADTTARDAIAGSDRRWGMVVYVSGENRSYFLNAGLDDDLSDNTKWVAFGTAGDKRSLNVSGGKLRLMAGRSTGTGTPGTLSLACERTLDADPGENTKGTTYDFITLDGAEDATSATVVKLRWNGSEYRLHVGAAGTGPGGTGRALYLVG